LAEYHRLNRAMRKPRGITVEFKEFMAEVMNVANQGPFKAIDEQQLGNLADLFLIKMTEIKHDPERGMAYIEEKLLIERDVRVTRNISSIIA
jgi:hypothetical protein